MLSRRVFNLNIFSFFRIQIDPYVQGVLYATVWDCVLYPLEYALFCVSGDVKTEGAMTNEAERTMAVEVRPESTEGAPKPLAVDVTLMWESRIKPSWKAVSTTSQMQGD